MFDYREFLLWIINNLLTEEQLDVLYKGKSIRQRSEEL